MTSAIQPTPIPAVRPKLKPRSQRHGVAVTENLTLEAHIDSVTLEARYPWTASEALEGLHLRCEHLNVPITDVPALIMALVRTLQESGNGDIRGIGNVFSAHTR